MFYLVKPLPGKPGGTGDAVKGNGSQRVSVSEGVKTLGFWVLGSQNARVFAGPRKTRTASLLTASLYR